MPGKALSSNPAGWRYAHKPCPGPNKLIFRPTPDEYRTGSLTQKRLRRAAALFRRCGVVVLEGVVPEKIADNFSAALNSRMAPILASRSALRRKMKESMRRGESPRDFWSRDATRADLFFSEGHTFRERNDGRIDMRVGFEPPFNASEIAANSFAFPVLTRVLGQDLRLKSIHAIQALPQQEGASTEPQHWHRYALSALLLVI